MCDEKWVLYDNQVSDWTKKQLQSISQTKLAPQRVMVTIGGLLPVWSTTAFWILVKTLHLRNTLSNWMRCTENCNACSWHCSTERTQFFYMTTPNCASHNQHFKTWANWGIKFCLTAPPHSPDLSPTEYHIFKYPDHFLQGKWFHNQQDAENAFQELVESQNMDLYATWINKLLFGKKKSVLIVMTFTL